MLMMKILFIKLLLVHYAMQSQTDIQTNCNDDVSLECKDDNRSREFISVAWYKVNEQGKKRGIIRKNRGDESPQPYKFNRTVMFGANHSLFLPNVTPEDSGIYVCSISAIVGGQNVNPKVNLIVQACMTQAPPTAMTMLTLNTTQGSEPLCLEHLKDLPVMWTIVGYVAVGLAKIFLSLVVIWVIRSIRLRSSRQNRYKW
ncbi:uncharacterized protein LOC128357402 [Scomber japonicus]|uniref:uncharacterized protein LOC128357402 n=1 Tax=Scomber japonicus TaxID=13676 RepID=UPI0023053C34|nr:uncharacterized protein LOC128357402 [Scomber japonicus]